MFGDQASRLFDSRNCKCKLGPNYELNLQWIGPPFITTFVLNVTATNTTGSGYLSVYPDDGSMGAAPPPLASDLNYRTRQTVPNLTVVMMNIYNESFDVYNGGGWADFVVDGEGYYGSGSSGSSSVGQVVIQAGEPGSYLLSRTRTPAVRTASGPQNAAP